MVDSRSNTTNVCFREALRESVGGEMVVAITVLHREQERQDINVVVKTIAAGIMIMKAPIQQQLFASLMTNVTI